MHDIAKTKFVTINSIVMLAEKSLSWNSTTQWSHFLTTTQILSLLGTQAKSEHSQGHTQSLLEASLEIAKVSHHVTHQHVKNIYRLYVK